METLTQFYLLQYKNWKLQYRKKLVTFIEIILPVVLCVLMVSIRTLIVVNHYPNATRYEPYALDEVLNKNWSVVPYTPNTAYTAQIMQNLSMNMKVAIPNFSGELYFYS